jgi:hypothetical protein
LGKPEADTEADTEAETAETEAERYPRVQNFQHLPPAELPRASKNQRKTGGKTILQTANNQKNHEHQKTKNVKKKTKNYD